MINREQLKAEIATAMSASANSEWRNELALAKKQQIVQIANQRGWFAVTLRYRDKWIDDLCEELCSEGKLRRQRKIVKGQYIYTPPMSL
jgi:hypothetical protein